MVVEHRERETRGGRANAERAWGEGTRNVRGAMKAAATPAMTNIKNYDNIPENFFSEIYAVNLS